MTVADTYQFFLEFPSAGSREVFPVNSSLQWQWRRADGKRYHRKELVTRLIFANQHKDNIIDFDPWYLLERGKMRCDKVKLTIWKNCDGSNSEHYKGEATVLDAAFDAGLCTVDVKFAPDDPFTCILNNWEKERNVLAALTPVTVRVIQGTYQWSQTCMAEVPAPATDTFRFTQTVVTNCINQNEGWTLWKQFYSWVSNNDPNNVDAGVWSLQTQWIREFLDSATDPGGEWLPVAGGGYARPVAVVLEFENIGYGIVQRQYKTVFNGDIGIDNGVYLNDIITYLWDQFCSSLPLVSNFFGINPDGSQPANTAYTAALAKLQEIVVFAKGDIIRHDADENNTILNFSLKKILTELETIFNVELRPIDGTFYLEHYSYFETDLLLDLTAEKWLPCIKDKWAWSYTKDQVPPRETFQWEDYTDYGPNLDIDFDGLPIVYSELCGTEGGDKLYRIDHVTTNITKLIASGNPEDFTIVNGYSHVLVATSGGYILREAGAISGIVHLNAALAWANIHRDYWKWGRPLNRGLMNGNIMDFISPKRIRKQVPIEIPICCADLENFDADRMLIKTQLGFGEVESATFDDPPGLLTVELIFD